MQNVVQDTKINWLGNSEKENSQLQLKLMHFILRILDVFYKWTD